MSNWPCTMVRVYFVQSTLLRNRYQIHYTADFDCQLVQIEYQLMPQYSIFNPYIDSGNGRITVGQDLDLSGLCRD